MQRLLIFKDLKTCLVFLYTNVYRTSHLFFTSTVISFKHNIAHSLQ